MSRFMKTLGALMLCCAMAVSASAQKDGQGHRGDSGGKQPRDIQREPKGGGDHRGGGNDQSRPRDDNGNRGDSGNRGGGKHGNKPNDLQ